MIQITKSLAAHCQCANHSTSFQHWRKMPVDDMDPVPDGASAIPYLECWWATASPNNILFILRQVSIFPKYTSIFHYCGICYTNTEKELMIHSDKIIVFE
uniref:Uncharacterized protein n=1 Tax=Micrurus lemniscatus lemniscatus TaxID=129467 RepID=A0A2D4H804_MICLE